MRSGSCSGKNVEQTKSFYEKPMRKLEAPQAYRSMLPSKYEVLAGHHFSWFLVLHKSWKICKIWYFWRSGTGFSRFGPDFWEVRFSINLRSAKSRTKVCQKWTYCDFGVLFWYYLRQFFVRKSVFLSTLFSGPLRGHPGSDFGLPQHTLRAMFFTFWMKLGAILP